MPSVYELAGLSQSIKGLTVSPVPSHDSARPPISRDGNIQSPVAGHPAAPLFHQHGNSHSLLDHHNDSNSKKPRLPFRARHHFDSSHLSDTMSNHHGGTDLSYVNMPGVRLNDRLDQLTLKPEP